MAGHESNRRLVWAAGLLVAAGAGVATAHGLYEVAAAAGAPAAIAWLYPLITDGLALVAYAATSRVTDDGGRRYAAAIVVLAAGLSGLAQATYLTGTLAVTGARASVPEVLRFGVGAWPAIAAALTAHLLHLISADPIDQSQAATVVASVQPSTPASVQSPDAESSAVQPPRSTSAATHAARTTHPDGTTARTERHAASSVAAPARQRAITAARDHHAHRGVLPTVSELMTLAEVARGTAGAVLKELRANRPTLHVVPSDPTTRTTP